MRLNKNKGYGESRWLSQKEITNLVKSQSDTVPEKNLILSEDVKISMNQKVLHRNNNVLALGDNVGLDMLAMANILNASNSYVIMDSKYDNFYNATSDFFKRNEYTLFQVNAMDISSTPTTEQILDMLTGEQPAAIFIKDNREAIMADGFDRALYPKGYITCGELIANIMSGLDKMNDENKWINAKNHNIRFVIDYRGEQHNFIPDLSPYLCAVLPRLSYVAEHGISTIILANKINELDNDGYVKSNSAEILGDCSKIIYAGGNQDADTAKMISAQCGKRFLTKIESVVRYYLYKYFHWDIKIPLELISTTDVLQLSINDCIVLLQGEQPIRDKICKPIASTYL